MWCFALCHILHDDGYIKPFVGKTSLWCTKCAKSWDATLMLVCNKCSRRWHMGCLTSSLKKTKEVLGPNSTIQTSLNGSFLFAIHAKVKHYHQSKVLSGSYPTLLGIPTTLEYPGISHMRDDLEPIIIHFDDFRLYIPLINARVFTNVRWTQEKVTINPNQGIRVVFRVYSLRFRVWNRKSAGK